MKPWPNEEETDLSKKQGINKPNYATSVILLVITGLFLLCACIAPNGKIGLNWFLKLATGLFAILTWVSFSIDFDQLQLYRAAKKGDEAYQKEKEKQDQKIRELEQWKKEKKAKKYNQYAYTCPMCGSNTVINISVVRKGIGMFTLGLTGKTKGKTYQCEVCKYMW